MKGDAFREMAARCGELPDSVMAAPGLEFVGEKSAEWEALCQWACGDPIGYDEEHAAECNDLGCCFPPPRELAGLALFANLMALVTRGE